ncbi:hypothetical protein ACSBR2_018409 [Camellia fascicularis]
MIYSNILVVLIRARLQGFSLLNLKALIEVKPHAEKWKCTPIDNYEKLAEIYGKDRATGVGAKTAKEKVRR